jgi:hypothetical protein
MKEKFQCAEMRFSPWRCACSLSRRPRPDGTRLYRAAHQYDGEKE